MKIYIIQEDYDCTEEDSLGKCSEVHRDSVVSIATTREDMLKALAIAAAENCEEYYFAGIDDYVIHEAEITDGGITDEFDYVKLTDEEKDKAKKLKGEHDRYLQEKYGK